MGNSTGAGCLLLFIIVAVVVGAVIDMDKKADDGLTVQEAGESMADSTIGTLAAAGVALILSAVVALGLAQWLKGRA